MNMPSQRTDEDRVTIGGNCGPEKIPPFVKPHTRFSKAWQLPNAYGSLRM
jgi:hypothetical protein